MPHHRYASPQIRLTPDMSPPDMPQSRYASTQICLNMCLTPDVPQPTPTHPPQPTPPPQPTLTAHPRHPSQPCPYGGSPPGLGSYPEGLACLGPDLIDPSPVAGPHRRKLNPPSEYETNCTKEKPAPCPCWACTLTPMRPLPGY